PREGLVSPMARLSPVASGRDRSAGGKLIFIKSSKERLQATAAKLYPILIGDRTQHQPSGPKPEKVPQRRYILKRREKFFDSIVRYKPERVSDLVSRGCLKINLVWVNAIARIKVEREG